MTDEAYDDDDEFNDEYDDDDDDNGDDDEFESNDDGGTVVVSTATGGSGVHSTAGASASTTSVPAKRKRGGRRTQSYAPSLREMMYGFGDVAEPIDATVNVMEQIAVEYMTEMTRKAIRVNGRPGKVETQDIVFLIRRDPKKVDRVRELIRMRQEMHEMRKLTEGTSAPN